MKCSRPHSISLIVCWRLLVKTFVGNGDNFCLNFSGFETVGNHNTGKTTTVCYNGGVESLLPYPGVRGGQFHTICSWPAILLFRPTRAKQMDERDDGSALSEGIKTSSVSLRLCWRDSKHPPSCRHPRPDCRLGRQPARWAADRRRSSPTVRPSQVRHHAGEKVVFVPAGLFFFSEK